jgi:hypothetical protein
MKISIKIALLFAACFIVLKLAFMTFGFFSDTIGVPGAINNLFLLLTITIGMYLTKKEKGFTEGSALEDIKTGLTGAIPYVIVVSIFLGFYYGKIDKSYVESKVEMRVDNFNRQMEDPARFKQLLEQQPELVSKTREEIKYEFIKSTRSALNANSVMIVSLLALTVLGAFYSIAISFIYRRVLIKGVK